VSMFRVWVNRLTAELANPVVAVVDVLVSVELHAVFTLARSATTRRLSVNVRVLLAVLAVALQLRVPVLLAPLAVALQLRVPVLLVVLAVVLPYGLAVLLVVLAFVLQPRFAVLLAVLAVVLQLRFAVLLVVLAVVLRVLLAPLAGVLFRALLAFRFAPELSRLFPRKTLQFLFNPALSANLSKRLSFDNFHLSTLLPRPNTTALQLPYFLFQVVLSKLDKIRVDIFVHDNDLEILNRRAEIVFLLADARPRLRHCFAGLVVVLQEINRSVPHKQTGKVVLPLRSAGNADARQSRLLSRDSINLSLGYTDKLRVALNSGRVEQPRIQPFSVQVFRLIVAKAPEFEPDARCAVNSGITEIRNRQPALE